MHDVMILDQTSFQTPLSFPYEKSLSLSFSPSLWQQAKLKMKLSDNDFGSNFIPDTLLSLLNNEPLSHKMIQIQQISHKKPKLQAPKCLMISREER